MKRFPVPRSLLDSIRSPGRGRTTTALDHVHLTVGAGEIVGLLGPNGAGKSTLVKILSTLVLPDAGSALIGGHDVVRSPARARRLIAPVATDERSLDWRLPATENLRFFGALHGLRGTALAARIREVLADVELAEVGTKLVGSFSSGMKQRLLIARALLARPRVLLLDEPTRSLDPLAARGFRAFLRREIVDRQGCTILLATHDPEEALELCDRIAIMARGRVLVTGTPAEVSRQVGDARYRVWSRAPLCPDDVARATGDVVLRPAATADEDGWHVTELELPTHADSASVLAGLVRAGAVVGRFEKVQLSLADLMDRVIRHEGGRADA